MPGRIPLKPVFVKKTAKSLARDPKRMVFGDENGTYSARYPAWKQVADRARARKAKKPFNPRIKPAFQRD